jgi:hypothetical protein
MLPENPITPVVHSGLERGIVTNTRVRRDRYLTPILTVDRVLDHSVDVEQQVANRARRETKDSGVCKTT